MPHLLLTTLKQKEEFFSKKGFVTLSCLLNPDLMQKIKE